MASTVTPPSPRQSSAATGGGQSTISSSSGGRRDDLGLPRRAGGALRGRLRSGRSRHSSSGRAGVSTESRRALSSHQTACDGGSSMARTQAVNSSRVMIGECMICMLPMQDTTTNGPCLPQGGTAEAFLQACRCVVASSSETRSTVPPRSILGLCRFLTRFLRVRFDFWENLSARRVHLQRRHANRLPPGGGCQVVGAGRHNHCEHIRCKSPCSTLELSMISMA